MSNTLLTPTQITREALRVLHNNLVFIKGLNRQYNDEFAKQGAKIGSTVNIRKPNRYFVRKGPAMQTQGTTETYVPLTLNNQWGTDISFSSTELTLSLDDFSKRVLTPAMAKIASQMDQDCLQAAITGSMVGANATNVSCGSPVFNIVGTPGTTPGTDGGSATALAQYNAPIVFLNAGMQMDNNATPRDENRRIVLSPAAMAQSVAGLANLFNDQSALAEQYKKGVLGHALGFEFAMDQNVYTFTSGTATSLGTVTLTAGQSTCSAASVTSVGTVLAGTIFTVAGVYAVNPENQQSTGQLQQFVVTADTTAVSTNIASLPIYPTPIVAAAGVANGTVSAVAAASATILSSGAASTAYQQSLAYHQDAFTLATADLEMPSGVDFAARETYDGISMRIVRAFDITNDQFPCRIDVLGGFANIRPELACRITG
jgi:hypothetical protein